MFDERLYQAETGDLLSKNRFSQVEMAVAFRKAVCYRCGHAALYKYKVKHLRRNPEILCGEGEEVRPDHEEMWRAIPRFCEIPQTVKCKKCGEVMGFYGEQVY
ncbi:MAG TPA: hypothetical protein VLU25_20135 [Acidobacteriota bacterium]|nr:hypothetical protein [Acidobacteriota bacterium]